MAGCVRFEESVLPLALWKKSEPARAAFVAVKHPHSAVLRVSKRKISQSKRLLCQKAFISPQKKLKAHGCL